MTTRRELRNYLKALRPDARMRVWEQITRTDVVILEIPGPLTDADATALRLAMEDALGLSGAQVCILADGARLYVERNGGNPNGH